MKKYTQQIARIRPMTEFSQTDEFTRQSDRYFKDNSDKTNLFFDMLTPKTDIRGDVNNILDVGCGSGKILNEFCRFFQASEGLGIEPSKSIERELKRMWEKNNPPLNFCEAFAHSIPAETNSYDLVTCIAVLSWVGREKFLQSVGEIVRVSKKYILIGDFVSAQPYKTPYKHANNTFTYKTDFETAFLASGILRVVEKWHWIHDPETSSATLAEEKDFESFENNSNCYHGRKMVLFEKDDGILQMRTPSFFGT